MANLSDPTPAPASPPHATQYVRMLRRWQEHASALAARSTGSADLENLPPRRWCRDEHVRQVMERRWGSRYTDYRDKLARARARVYEPESPIHIDFDVVDYCNLSCQNCSENFRDWTKARLDVDVLRKDPFFAERRLLSANVGNAAEPFLAPEKALELIRFLRASGVIDIFIHTNALLLKESVVDALIDEEVSWVSVSIDAFSDETYRITRGKRNPGADSGYSKAVDAIHTILRRRRERGSDFPLVRLSFLVVPENQHEMRAFHDYWRPLVDMVEFQDFVAPNPIGDTREPYITGSTLFEHEEESSCSMPWFRMSVHPGGTVGPCCSSYGHLDELRLGDLKAGGTIMEMWTSQKLSTIRSAHLASPGADSLSTCAQCLRQNYKFKYYGADVAQV